MTTCVEFSCSIFVFASVDCKDVDGFVVDGFDVMEVFWRVEGGWDVSWILRVWLSWYIRTPHQIDHAHPMIIQASPNWRIPVINTAQSHDG